MGKIILGALLALFAFPAMAEPLSTAFTAVTSWLGASGTAAAAGALGGLVGGKLMGKGPKMPKPAVMPTADDAAVQAAKRRQIAEMQARGGRASTVLSDDNKLGG